SFQPLCEKDILAGLNRAICDKNKGLGNIKLQIDDEALKHLAWASGGDMRTALNALELAALTTHADESGIIKIGKSEAEQSIQQKSLSFDESMYYDIISAFIKSMRGSDSNAALYWGMRLIDAGCDPMLIARRIVIHASEDVGMADPNALVVAVAAMTAYEKLGLPEGRIPLAEGIVYVAEAPKSNKVYVALESATEAVKTVKRENVPIYLRDQNYKSLDEKSSAYKYPHDFGGWVEQQYLPDEIKDEIFYSPTENGFEKTVKERQKSRETKKK
ncbi:MAG: replication-associated recombination protein A, partial [Clostridia bacterium]